MSLRGNTVAVAEHMKKEIQERLWRRPASRCSRRASATWPTRRRSRRRCCSASRRARSSPRASGSSKARSAWSRWRSTCCRSATSSTLDNERKAAMVSNLLVVLCGDRDTQPVVNTGTIYQ